MTDRWSRALNCRATGAEEAANSSAFRRMAARALPLIGAHLIAMTLAPLRNLLSPPSVHCSLSDIFLLFSLAEPTGGREWGTKLKD